MEARLGFGMFARFGEWGLLVDEELTIVACFNAFYEQHFTNGITLNSLFCMFFSTSSGPRLVDV
jgi:hypothetical protein